MDWGELLDAIQIPLILNRFFLDRAPYDLVSQSIQSNQSTLFSLPLAGLGDRRLGHCIDDAHADPGRLE